MESLRFFAIFILLFAFLAVVQEETHFSPVFESNGIFPMKSVVDEYILEFGFLEALLLFLCSVIVKIQHERRKVNSRFLKKLALFKIQTTQEEAFVSRLEPYLEDSRSRNSGVEMPLRRMAHEIADLIGKTGERIKEYTKLGKDFGDFKEQWKIGYESYRKIPEKVIIASIIDARVKAELDGVKEYIEKEMQEVRNVMEAVRAMYS